ncbi:MAG TPA: E3 binding domain-containing protein, partial [Conexibacter sp.]|nr:E3 binding domain-containing protein [Conexibacter sp.]
MPEITMPRLSDSMEEGTILRWLVADGAAVARGDEIAEIETDKANMTYEADAAGVFHHVASEGDALPVGALIAHVLAEGETPPAGAAGNSASGSAAAPAGPESVPPTRAHAGPSAGARASSSPPAGSAAVADAGGVDAAASSAASPSMPAVGDGSAESGALATGGRVKASPLARRLARERGVDLSTVTGTGTGGRIVRADVEKAAAGGSAPAAPAAPVAAPTAPAPGGTGKGEVTVVALTSTQKT